MAANFTTSQSSGDLSVAILTDTSTGLGSITGRLVYIRKYNGDYLVPDGTTTDYVFWPVVSGTGDTLSVDILDKDYCLEIAVVMYSGSSVDSTVTKVCLFTGYGDLWLRKLTQALAANRTNLNQKNFYYNKLKLRTLLDDAAQAVVLINDQTIAQQCLDESYKLTNVTQLFI